MGPRLIFSEREWFFEVNDKQFGPYKTLNELNLDLANIAEKSGFDIADLYRIVFRAKMRRPVVDPTRAAKLDALIEELSEQGIELLETDSKKLYGLGFDPENTLVWVIVWMPARVEKDEGRKKKTYTGLYPFILTNEKRLIPLDQANEDPFFANFTIPSFPRPAVPRWSPASVREYLGRADKINPKTVFNNIFYAVKRFFEFENDEDYLIITLWIINTAFYHIFNATPYLFIQGPKGSGKTKLLLFITTIAPFGLLSTNISVASLFRSINVYRTTVGIDENERLNDVNERTFEIRSILLGGYKSGLFAHRVEDKNGGFKEVVEYDVYSPKVLANIAGFETTLLDRGIFIHMIKARDESVLNAEISPTDEFLISLRSLLFNLYLDHAAEIYDLVNDGIETGLSGRQNELWKPLIVLGAFFERYGVNNLKARIVETAKKKSLERSMIDANENTLLEFLQFLWEKGYDGWIYQKDIHSDLVELDEFKGWATTRWIGKSLKTLGFQEFRKTKGNKQVLIKRNKIRDLLERYNIEIEIEKLPEPIIEKIPQIGTKYICPRCNAVFLSESDYEKHKCEVSG